MIESRPPDDPQCLLISNYRKTTLFSKLQVMQYFFTFNINNFLLIAKQYCKYFTVWTAIT